MKIADGTLTIPIRLYAGQRGHGSSISAQSKQPGAYQLCVLLAAGARERTV